MYRSILIAAYVACSTFIVKGQTADEIAAKYVQKIGGLEKLQAIKTVRMSGRSKSPGGSEVAIVYETKRPNFVRRETSQQGLTAIRAFDGRNGWKINPFEGKKDAEAMGETESKQIVEDSDFDGPLVNYVSKGNKLELMGKEDFEGSDVFKLKVTLADGTVKYYFLDTEYCVPIKIETKQINRGTESESEIILGDYKQVGGVYFPFSLEFGAKGRPARASITFDKIEMNTPIDDQRFTPTKIRDTKKP